MFDYSVFVGAFDNKPQHMECGSFEELFDHLKELSTTKIEPTIRNKDAHLMYSCAIYDEGSLRRKTLVKSVSRFLPLDFDHNVTIEKMVVELGRLNANFIIYSTTGHLLEKGSDRYADADTCENVEERFRVILELDRVSDPTEYYQLWGGANAIFWKLVDKQTKDVTRLHIFPATWSQYSFIDGFFGGQPLSVDWLISQCPEDVVDTLVETISDRNFEDVKTNVSTDLYNSEIVSTRFIDEYHGASSSGGRYFRFLCQVASRAKALGYDISAYDLHDIGLQMDRAGNKSKKRELREAKRALSHTYAQHFEPAQKKWVDNLTTSQKLKMIRKRK